jgi:hypothetical protein
MLPCLSNIMNPPSNALDLFQFLSWGNRTLWTVLFNIVRQRYADVELVRIRIWITRLAELEDLLGTISVVELLGLLLRVIK